MNVKFFAAMSVVILAFSHAYAAAPADQHDRAPMVEPRQAGFTAPAYAEAHGSWMDLQARASGTGQTVSQHPLYADPAALQGGGG